MYLKRFFYTISLLFCLLTAAQEARASHAMGADLQYQCLGNNTYRIVLRFYRDCAGIDAPTSVTVQLFSPCAGTTSNLTLTKNVTVNCPPGSQNACEVSQLCPSQLSQSACNWTGPGVAPYPGVEVHEYVGNFTFPSACPNWRIRFTECCRNNVITNVQNPAGNNLSIEATVNNTINPATGQPYCNNSVSFTSVPVPFVCAQSDVTYNNGAVDVDGDSIVYSLITPLGNNYAPMTFNAGWNVNNPVRTNPANSFGFNTSTGQMDFTPAQQEIDVLAVKIEEYRNGVLIGSTMRDIQVSILNCAITIPAQEPITNVQNGNQVDSLSVQVCPGTPLQFDILCTDAANHNLIVTSNINATPSAIPGATMTQIGTGDTVTARITWTPLPADTGCHDFILYTENDDCPIKGSYTRVYTICVFTKVQLLSASPVFCGTPVQLTATGGTNFAWTPNTGPNAVSNPNSLNPTVSPTVPTTYFFASDCGVDSVLVGAAPPFQYDAGPGGSICQNGQLQLNATTDNLYAPYQIEWIPSNGLIDPVSGLPTNSILNPVASPLTTTNYKFKVTGVNGCTNTDSVLVTVAGTGPVIDVKAQPAAVCPNEEVKLKIVTSPQFCGVSTTPCSGNVMMAQVGTGTGQTPTGSPTTYPTVYGHYSNSARHQFLFLASELLAQFPSGGEIRSLAFNVSQINTANDSIQNFEIKLGCTQASALSSWQANLTTVFTPKKIYMGPTTNTGWKTHVFDVPYNWDGTSNLVVDVCFNNPTGGALNAKMQMTPTTFNSVYFSKANSSQCGITGTPATSVNRPNTRFNMCVSDVSGLPIVWTPTSGTNAPIPAVNVDTTRAYPQVPLIYSVDVTAPNGCISTDFVYVNVDTSLRFNAFPVDTFFCNPTAVNLTTQTIGSPLPGNQFTYQFVNLTTNAVISNSTTNNVTVNPTTTTSYLVRLLGGACVLTDTIRVQIGSSIPVNLAVDSIPCFGQTVGQITASPSGGTPPITYAWNNGASSSVIQNLGIGTYTVSVSDAIGCTGTATATLIQPAQLQVTAATQNVNCFGANNGTITLTTTGGTPNYTYQWSPAQPAQASITGIAGGAYSATVTDSKNCSVTISSTISEPTDLVIVATSTDAVSFGGNEGTASVTASGATPGYTYTWSNGGNTSSIQNLTAGTYIVTVCDANNCCKQDTVIVNDPPPIILSYVTTNNLCFGDCNGTIKVSATGGIEPYTFTWNTATVSDSIFGLCAGTYTVTVSDSAGITVQGSVNITAPSQVTITLTSTEITCFGANNGAVLAVASGGTAGYTYNWTPGGATNPQTNLGPGTYIVVATDANNCTAQAAWTAIEPSQVTATITSTTDVSCFGGNNGSATVLAAGGTPGYTYNWASVGSGSTTATGFTNGGFDVTVSDANLCTAIATFTINQPTQLVASLISSTNATCNGAANGAVDISVSGGSSPYGFTWSNGAQTEDLNAVVANSYQVTVSDTQNCTTTVSAVVTEPTAISLKFSSTNPLCAGQSNGTATVSATGGTAGYVYDWTFNASGNDNSSQTGLPAGVYTVNVTDQNSCTAQGNVTLTDPSTLTTAFINKSEITCANAADGSVEVQVNGGTPPISFVWSNNATNALVNNLAPGAYQVTTSDNNGCSTVMNISFASPPTIEILLLAIDPVSCPTYTDGAIQISAIGGTPGQTTAYQYSIDGTNFQTAEFFQNLSAGNYTVSIRDSQGCLKDTTIQVIEPAVLDLLVLPTDSTIDLGSSIALVSSVSNYGASDINYYSWSPLSGLNCSDCATTVATPYYTTDFTLTVNYLQNCAVSETVRVNVGDGEDFYVPNAFSPNGDGNNDVLEVYGRGLAKVDLTIFNRWGEKVFDSNNQWQGWDGNYKGIESPAGVYTYYVEATYLNGKTKGKKGTITIIR